MVDDLRSAGEGWKSHSCADWCWRHRVLDVGPSTRCCRSSMQWSTAAVNEAPEAEHGRLVNSLAIIWARLDEMQGVPMPRPEPRRRRRPTAGQDSWAQGIPDRRVGGAPRRAAQHGALIPNRPPVDPVRIRTVRRRSDRLFGT